MHGTETSKSSRIEACDATNSAPSRVEVAARERLDRGQHAGVLGDHVTRASVQRLRQPTDASQVAHVDVAQLGTPSAAAARTHSSRRVRSRRPRDCGGCQSR